MRKAMMGLLVLAVLVVGGWLFSTPDAPTISVERSVPEYFEEHARYFEKGTHKIGDKPAWAIVEEKSFGNINMIEGGDGLIIIDTGLDLRDAKKAMEQIRQLSDKPVKAVIYTHHHADHISGTRAFVTPEQVASGEVQVIAAHNFMREYRDENAVVGPIMGQRAIYMYGVMLEEEDKAHYHVGCCGTLKPGAESGFIAPNRLVNEREEMEIAGVRLLMFQTGGESASHMVVYLPDWQVLFIGDELQGPTLPQLHSLRGTKFRDSVKWTAAIDLMRGYQVSHLVPSHGLPVSGEGEIERVLTAYRDAIQYQHDQSVRLINKGYTQDELANSITLPESLKIEPWTREMYGAVKSNVRSYYTGYISWWNGDPADLDPIPRVEFARRFVAGFGGRDVVLAQAQTAFDSGDYQWAAELTKYLVRIDHEDWPARQLKAAALKTIGYQQTSSSWRSLYLSAARELEGSIEPQQARAMALKVLKDPDALANIPSEILLGNLRYRVDPQEAADQHIRVGFHFPDRDEHYSLELRNSVIEFREGAGEQYDVVVRMNRSVYDRVVAKQLSFAKGLIDGSIDYDGSILSFKSFIGALDLTTEPAFLSVR